MNVKKLLLKSILNNYIFRKMNPDQTFVDDDIIETSSSNQFFIRLFYKIFPRGYVNEFKILLFTSLPLVIKKFNSIQF